MSEPRLSRAMTRHVQSKEERRKLHEALVVAHKRRIAVGLKPWKPTLMRMRRGKLVEIPEDWQEVVTYPQTIRKRNPVKRRTRKEHR